MRLFSLLLLLVALRLPVSGQPGKLYFEQLTTADGLPENSVTAMIEDHLGFIWLGTRNGLVRYDGVTMTTFQNNPKDPYSLKARAISYLYEDRRGDIWVGCIGGLYRFERATERFIAYAPTGENTISSKDAVWSIHEDKYGSFWIGLYYRLKNIYTVHRYDPKTNAWVHYRHQEGNPRSLAFDNVFYISATGIQRICLAEDRQGVVWVVTRKRFGDDAEAILHRYDRLHDTFIPYCPKGISATDSVFRFIKSPRFSRRGELWAPTYSQGLFRINPVTNQVIAHYRHNPQNPQSLLCDTVRTVYEDRSGYFWVSTRQGLDRLDPKTGLFRHFRYDPNNIHTPHDLVVDAIRETPNGHIWFLTTVGGLDEYDPKTEQFTRYETNTGQPGGLVGGSVSALLIDHTGLIWASSGSPSIDDYSRVKEGALNRQSRITRFSSFDYGASTTWQSGSSVMNVVYEAPSEPGVYWIGTNQGVDRYDKKTGQVSHYALDLKSHLYQSGRSQVTSLTEDAEKRFWIGTTNGLYLLDRQRGSFTHFSQNLLVPNQLNHPFVTALLATRDSTLWVGTAWGLNQFNPRTHRFTTYSKADTAYHPNLFQLLKSVTTPANQLATLRPSPVLPEAIQPFSLKEPTMVAVSVLGSIGRSALNEYGWIEDATGHTIWQMAYPRTRSAGPDKRIQIEAIRLPAGTYTLHYQNRVVIGIGKDAKFIVMPSSFYPELWGITLLRVTAAEADSLNKLSRKWVFTGLSGNYVQSLHQDKKGRIWIGLANVANAGLNQFDPHTGRFIYYHTPGNELNTITAIHEDASGNLWLGDYINGLFWFNPDTGAFKRYTTADGLSHNSVMGIQADDRGQLWLNTNNGISRFDPKTKRFRTYTSTNGLSGMIFRSPSFKSADGTLFFPGDQGINTMLPGQLYDDPNPPRVVLTDIDIFNQKAPIGPDKPLTTHSSIASQLTLAANQNDITFHFAALHYTRSAECRYAVKLAPYDNDWVSMGTTRQIRYTSLQPRTYTFHVKAANADGVWNQIGTSIQVVVLPPWWATWWMYSLYGMGFIGISFAISRIWRQQLIDKERAKTRDRELAQSREIEKAYHQLQQTQAQLIQKEKLASLGELTAGIAHEIQNPLNFVNNFAEVSVELVEELEEEAQAGRMEEVKAISSDLRENLQRITQNGQRASNIVRGMLEHSRTSTGERLPTDLNALCDEYLRLAYQGMRSKDPGFICQLETRFDTDLPLVSVVASDISRVLLNLYNNAFYAVNQKQQMAPVEYRPTVSVSTRYSNGHVEIWVRDNGMGIPDAIKEKIFQPFFTTKPTGEGTGLGLSLSYDIVTKGHGGTLTVQSQPGQFTEFMIALPFSNQLL